MSQEIFMAIFTTKQYNITVSSTKILIFLWAMLEANELEKLYFLNRVKVGGWTQQRCGRRAEWWRGDCPFFLLSGGVAGAGCRRFTPMDVRLRSSFSSPMAYFSSVYSVKLSTKPSVCGPFFFLAGNLCPDILVETNTC
jgi:hypothetical protein